MIDIENKVFDTIAKALRTAHLTAYPNLVIYGEYVPVSDKFPCVSIVEADNYVFQPTISLDRRENHARVMYEIQIFANDGNKKKQTAKKLADTVDNEMSQMGFVRTLRAPIPDLDRTIYRIMLRYTAVVSRGKENGTTITHYIFNNGGR